MSIEISPIFVPSKGRPDSKLLALLRKAELNYTVFVEPQEFKTYHKEHSGMVYTLPANDQGLAYARNSILNYARSDNLEAFWMIDDDVTEFFYGAYNGYEKTSVSMVLSQAERLLKGFAQGALEYSQFGFSSLPGEHSDGGYCDVCVRIEPARVEGIQYRSEVNLKEDRDFTLQVLAKGERTRRISNLGFSCPANGSNKGGLYDLYKAGKEKQAAEALARLWPHCVTVQKKKNGRTDAKIEWRNVRQDRLFV